MQSKIILSREEQEQRKKWSKLAIGCFAKDWGNEKDSIYDWRRHYHV